MKKIFFWMILGILLLCPTLAWAEGETPTPTLSPIVSPTPTAKAGFLPETIDAGPLNALAWDRLVRYRSLTVKGVSNGIWVDVLAHDTQLDGKWYSVNTRYLTAYGLTQKQVQPLLDAIPEGWHSLLLQNSDDGAVSGSMDGEEQRIFYQSIPEKVRLSFYDTNTGTVTVSQPLRLRQYRALVKANPAAGTAQVMTNTVSGIFIAKLLLRIMVATGITLLAWMPFFDRNRKQYVLLRLAGNGVYFLVVVFLHGITGYLYPLWVIALQAILVLAEAAVVYTRLQPGKMYLTKVYALAAYLPAAILGLWWLC